MFFDGLKETKKKSARSLPMMKLAMLVGVAVAAASAQDLPECRHTFPDGNSFDLTGLRKPPMYVCPETSSLLLHD